MPSVCYTIDERIFRDHRGILGEEDSSQGPLHGCQTKAWKGSILRACLRLLVHRPIVVRIQVPKQCGCFIFLPSQHLSNTCKGVSTNVSVSTHIITSSSARVWYTLYLHSTPIISTTTRPNQTKQCPNQSREPFLLNGKAVRDATPPEDSFLSRMGYP